MRDLADLPEGNVLVQPGNRGTAVAILHGLERVLMRDRAPLIVVMPSDQDVESEPVLANSVRQALAEVRRSPDYPVLLGITPESPDADYGWIVAAAPHGRCVHTLLTFVEKPTREVAARLMAHGALWNSFVMVSSGSALLQFYEDAQPMLLEAYTRGFATSHGDPNAAARVYPTLPDRDFVHDLVEREPHRLRVLPVPSCGWMDLGTPERVSAWLERHHESPVWIRLGQGASCPLARS
jgi:mannose-1-phosphate guanylyltransferase